MTRPTADLGDVLEEQTERLKADTPLNDVDFAGATVADLRALGNRLILYREALERIASRGGAWAREARVALGSNN